MIEEAVRTEEMAEVDEAKREFMKKFGKYAATAPVGMYLLMSPTASKAQASGSSIQCHAEALLHWEQGCFFKVESYIHYEANGEREGNCDIEYSTWKEKDGNQFLQAEFRAEVKNKETVSVYVKGASGNYYTLYSDIDLDDVFNSPYWSNTNLFKVLKDLDFNS